MHRHVSTTPSDRTVLGLTLVLLATFGFAALASAFPGATIEAIGQVAYYATNSGGFAGGAMAGTGAIVGAGIGASSLSGLALAGAVAGGVVGVVAVGA